MENRLKSLETDLCKNNEKEHFVLVKILILIYWIKGEPHYFYKYQ